MRLVMGRHVYQFAREGAALLMAWVPPSLLLFWSLISDHVASRCVMLMC